MAREWDLSRRQFLARSAGFAGASIGIATPGGAKGSRPGEEVRVSLVGAGDRGLQLLGALLRSGNVRVAAIADPDPAHLRRAADLARDHGPRLSVDGGSIIQGTDSDAVILATPVHLHEEQALLALAEGKHVYLEKPLAMTAPGCRRVLLAAQEASQKGRILQVGLQRRYNPRYRASMEAIHRGDAGRVLFIRAQWHSTGSPARGSKPWYHVREKSGDIVLEQACHQMDIFNWVFQCEPVRACAMGGTSLSDGGSPCKDILDHYGVSLEYPGGGMVHFSHLSFAIPDRRFAGVYELVLGERLGIDPANGIAWDRAGKTVELSQAGGNDTQAAVEGFLESLRTGGTPLADAGTGYSSAMASLLVLRALEAGRTVAWREILA